MSRGENAINAFSVDVEEYFPASALAPAVRDLGQASLQSRLRSSMDLLLAVLDDASVQATFFVLGCVAEHCPSLVREISSLGHEIASHGYSHKLIYRQSQAEFRQETARAKGILEDEIGTPVIGYRAASFSVTERSIWALQVLAEIGFLYDSSIFPIRHDRYGIPGAVRGPHTVDLDGGHSIVEVPMTVCEYGGVSVPVSGGGYFRLFPYWFTRSAMRRVNASGRPVIFYVHPWELDSAQPKLPVGLISRFRHYNNLSKTAPRLKRMLTEFRFQPIQSLLRDHGLTSGVSDLVHAC